MLDPFTVQLVAREVRAEALADAALARALRGRDRVGLAARLLAWMRWRLRKVARGERPACAPLYPARRRPLMAGHGRLRR